VIWAQTVLWFWANEKLARVPKIAERSRFFAFMILFLSLFVNQSCDMKAGGESKKNSH